MDPQCRGFEMRYTMTEGSQEMVVEITSHPERCAAVFFCVCVAGWGVGVYAYSLFAHTISLSSHGRDAVVEISGLASRPTTVMDMLRQRPLREFPSDISLAASTQGGYIWDPVVSSFPLYCPGLPLLLRICAVVRSCVCVCVCV